MGEHQCPVCGHITTGFEQQEFEAKQHELECLRERIAFLTATLRDIAHAGDAGAQAKAYTTLHTGEPTCLT